MRYNLPFFLKKNEGCLKNRRNKTDGTISLSNSINDEQYAFQILNEDIFIEVLLLYYIKLVMIT